MYSSYVIALFPVVALAAVNGKCSGTATGFWLSDGICEPTATCDYYHGTYITGGCPNDVDDVKCCLVGLDTSIDVNPCEGVSWCDWTSNSDCPGIFKTGYCPGNSNYKCCYTTS